MIHKMKDCNIKAGVLVIPNAPKVTLHKTCPRNENEFVFVVPNAPKVTLHKTCPENEDDLIAPGPKVIVYKASPNEIPLFNTSRGYNKDLMSQVPKTELQPLNPNAQDGVHATILIPLRYQSLISEGLAIEQNLDLPVPPVTHIPEMRTPERVRFLAGHQSVEIPRNTEEDLNNAWYSMTELELFRNKAHDISEQIIKRNALSTQPVKYISTICKAYADCIKEGTPGRKNMHALYTWVSKGHSRRGLEKWSVSPVGAHRRWRQANTVYHVLEEQKTLNAAESIGDRMKRIRRVSEFHSLVAKHFANAMAKADEMAANDSYIDNVVCVPSAHSP